MARNLAYYMDDEEERRRQGQALIESELAMGPPPPPPNLGVAPVPRLPIDMTTPRRTDGDYSGFRDSYQDEEPTEEELAADEAAEAEEEQVAPVAGERQHPLDVFLTDVGRAANPYEEKAQALSGAKLAAGSGAVDKTAASVSNEQKGVPASRLSLTTDPREEMGWADELLGQVQKRVLDKPEASATPLHQQAERVAGGLLEPQEGFSKQRQAELAREAYGQDSPPSTHWEDELLREHGDGRLTDAQIRRRAAAIGFLGAAFSGDMEAGTRWAAQQHAGNRDFEAARDRARERDRQGTRISRGLAAAIAQSGVPPEEAVKLTYGDPLVKAFSNGMYSQGGRAEGQAIGLQKAQLHEALGLIKSNNVDERTRGLAMLQSLTTLGAVELRAQALSQMTPEQIEALRGTMMASAVGVSAEKGAAVAAGDRSGLTAEQARKADLAAPTIDATLADTKTRNQVVADRAKAMTNAEQKRDNAVEQSIALIQNNPDKAREWQEKWIAAQIPLKNALQGWRAMTPGAKQALATWTQTNRDGSTLDLAHLGDQWNKYNELTPADQIHVSRVLGAINEYVKANAGSAVTGSEWDRIAHRIGMATGTWAPFNNPEVIGQFLKDAAEAMNESRGNYERTMKGWKK